MQVAQWNQGQRAMGLFIILYRLGGSPEAAVIVVVEDNHAAGAQAGIKVLKSRQDRGVEVSIQTDQSKAAVFQSLCGIWKKAFVKQGLVRVGKAASDKGKAGVPEVPIPGPGKPLSGLFLDIPGVKALKGIEEMKGPVRK